MWTRLGDFQEGFSIFGDLGHGFDRVREALEGDANRGGLGAPRVHAFESDAGVELVADVPGLTQADLKLTVHESTVTLEGERSDGAPEGYTTHRKERGALRFSRSYTLPFKVDAEKCEASVRNGVLKVLITRAEAAKPRAIEVRAN